MIDFTGDAFHNTRATRLMWIFVSLASVNFGTAG
jgi:hypothetical protein